MPPKRDGMSRAVIFMRLVPGIPVKVAALVMIAATSLSLDGMRWSRRRGECRW